MSISQINDFKFRFSLEWPTKLNLTSLNKRLIGLCSTVVNVIDLRTAANVNPHRVFRLCVYYCIVITQNLILNRRKTHVVIYATEAVAKTKGLKKQLKFYIFKSLIGKEIRCLNVTSFCCIQF